MKYIRTKDNICGERIYENDIPKPKNEHEKEVLRKLRNNIGEIVIKQADTIEELCDEFVVVHNSYLDDGKSIYYRVGSKACHRGDSYYDFTFEQVRTGRRNIGGTLYGAIWTNKGLIYVAKMNDKGELELL